VVERAVQIAQDRLADCSARPVLALHDRALVLALDVQVDTVVTPERRAEHDIAEGLEALANPFLEVFGRDRPKRAGRWCYPSA
jgi:hypothetical protein